MEENRHYKSSFVKDIELRKHWNNLSSNQLWRILFPKEPLLKLQSSYPKNLKHIYFSQKINHKGISKELYLKHPIRMSLFLKKYFPNLFSKLLVMILFHNILEVSSLSRRDIMNLLGINAYKCFKILTINRKMQFDFEYLRQYYSFIIKSPNCIIIKAIDKYDNLFDLKKNNNADIKKKYIKEIEVFLKPYLPKESLFTKVFIKNINKNKENI